MSLTDFIAAQSAAMAQLSRQVADLQQSVDTLTSKLAVSHCHHRVSDTAAADRRLNVIVSGLPESRESDDVVFFTKFCAEQRLPTMLSDVTASHRLGTAAANQRPRRLLVALVSEQRALDLLRYVAGRKLVTSSGERVYITRDLTREERQKAFERRQRRRQQFELHNE
jgi:hypothetical protein